MSEELIKRYQETGESEQLVTEYHAFIMKYYKMITQGLIDFENYDTRKFISCFIKDSETRKALIRGKYQTKAAHGAAHYVVGYLRRTFRDYDTYKPWEKHYPFDEIYRELAIIFLTCAKNYTDQGKSFKRYLYHSYRYYLKDLINSKIFDASSKKSGYVDIFAADTIAPIDEAGALKYEDNPFAITMDEDTDLEHNILWMNGIHCNELFQDLNYTERLILVKAFLDQKSDKEIAQLTGLHHRSVYRIKKRLVDYYKELWAKGAIKWIR
ncbi:RNA polymerase sigma factor, sigma-70 family [Paenibacillus sp. UNC496MF]|uniref:helix-turn-helix domain-containing protein n=1 Tax=Paenibacillus sp. UNC496MF TaxID=1502753 RepID=UPI0008F11458|nr:helix-turn-helix domain-containing protein [Paenibacillus sp. UNC496MF]SFJ65092.1 RNA polymerase sigma factor, sigma-70 family [Paenibacillus sp. UNC496MF]